MASTTPINGLPTPDDSSPNDPPIHFQALNNQLDTRLVPGFATTTARNNAITAPATNMMCSVAGYPQVYRSGAWHGVSAIPFSTTTVDTTLYTTSQTLMTLTVTDPQCPYKLLCSGQIIFGIVGAGVTVGGRIRVNGADLIVGSDAINSTGGTASALLTTIPPAMTGTLTGASTVTVFVSKAGTSGNAYQAISNSGLGLYNTLTALAIPV